MSATCPDPEHTEWTMCPSLPAAILFVVLFFLATAAHLLQALYYDKMTSYCWVVVGSALAQTVTYVCRVVSILNPNSLPPYAAWFVIILIAPLLTNAFVYMVMGRMIWNYVPDAKLYGVPAWRFSTYFVVFDILALVIQVIGASSSGASRVANQQVLRAIHIYMGGIAVQQFFILVFFFCVVKFHRIIIRQRVREGGGVKGTEVSGALSLLCAIYAVLLLITIRISFRLVEYSHGFQSKVPEHEAYQYGLDSVPMLLALVILSLVHPGRIMPGKENDLPTRKERKAMGNQNKPAKVGGVLGLIA